MNRLTIDDFLTSRLQLKQRRWSLALLVFAILVLSFGLPYRASQGQLRLILALTIGLGAAILFFRWSPVGLAVLVIASLIVPLEIGTGTNTSINVSMLMLFGLAALWLLGAISRRRVLLPVSSAIRPLALFVGVAFLAFGVGQLPWFSFAQRAPLGAQAAGLAVFVLSAAAFVLMAQQVRDLRWLRWITWAFLGLAGLYAAGRLIPDLGRITITLFQRGATGSVFFIWAVSLAVGQALFNRRLDYWWRLALAALALVSLYLNGMRGQVWASGWLPPLVAMIVTVGAGALRFGLVAAFAGSIVAALNLQKVIDFVMVGDNQYSLATRLEAWRIVAKVAEVNPILGLGPANYYWYVPLFPILGYQVRFSSHNNYVDLFAQTGLLGVACFIWFFWEVARIGWGLRMKVPEGFARAYIYGALGGLAGMLTAGMMGDWILPFVYNIGLNGFRASVLGWLFLGGIVALEQMHRISQETSV